MVGLFGWIEQNTGLNVSNYDFDDSGDVVGYTSPSPVTETVVLGRSSGNYTVEDAFGDVKSIANEDYTDWKRENDRKLAMLAGTYEPRDADERREMKAVQERAEMGETAYAKEIRASESDGPYYGVAVGDASSDAGTIKQDESGNWYTVVKNPNSNTVGRDYSIDPQDNSQGPTFGGNVSDFVAETFSDEVAAAGGSTEEPEFIGFTQLLENIVTGETTDVPSVGFDAGTGTFEAGAAAAAGVPAAVETDLGSLRPVARPTDLAPIVDADTFIPTGGPGTFVPGALPAAEVEFGEDYTPTSAELAAQLEAQGLTNITPAPLSVEDQVAQYALFGDDSFVEIPATPSGTSYEDSISGGYETFNPARGEDIPDISAAKADLDADQAAADVMESAINLGVLDDTILGPGEGGLSAPITVGDPMTPQLAAELGFGYFEGDTLTSADLEDLQGKGFVVDEDAIVGSMNLQLPEDFAEFVGAEVETTATNQAMQDLKDLTALEKAGYSLSDIENLTNAQIAAGLGRDVAGGFAQELALRIGGTKKMFEDALGDEIDVSAGALAGELFELGGGDFQPGSESELEASIQSAVAQTDLNKGVKGLGDSVDQMVSGLNTWSEGVFEGQSDEYKAAVLAGMPDPNNEGFNMLGEPFSITNPGLWMASTAAQELVGLGLDVGTVLALGPVGGSVIGLQQGFAEAGQAGLEEAQAELAKVRAAGGLDHLSDAQYQEALQTAGDLAYYTSGPVGALADTAVALTAGGFAPIAKLAPKMVKSVANALTITGTEAVSGGGEQVAVNNAIIETLKDNGVDVSQIDTSLLDGIREAMILEAVGGSTAAGSGAVAGLLSKNETDATKEKVIETANKILPANTQLDNTGTVIPAGGPGTFTPGALPAAADAANLTASEILQSGENVTVSTDDEGNLVLTDNDTNESATVGSSFSTGDNLTGGETTVSDLQGTEDAVIGGTDQNVVVSNVGGNLTLTNEDTGFTVAVGAGTNANLINATNAVQNSDANAAAAAGATVVDTTASEALLGGTDTNIDLGFEGLSDADTTDAESSLEGKTTIVTDGVTTQKGTGGIGTIGASDKDILATSIFGGTGVTGTGDATTGVTGTGDVTTGVTGTGDANTTITANNDATVTTSSDGNVTITTATDSQGNAIVTTKNNVTGETTTDNVAVNNTAVVTNSGVTVNVNAAVDGTTTTMVDPTVTVDPVVSSTITTKPVTSVEEPIVEIGQPQPAVDQPQTIVDQPQPAVGQPQPGPAQTSYTPPDSDGDPTTDPVGETQPGYTSGIADLGAGGRMRPVVAPYYQPQQTGLYSFYRPQPGVDQTPAAPVFNEPTSYLSPTGGLRYGNPYIGTNLSLAQLRELAELQGTGAAVLPSEDLMNGS